MNLPLKDNEVSAVAHAEEMTQIYSALVALRKALASGVAAQLEIARRLAVAVEWRDEETGDHVERMSLMCERLGL